MCLGVPGKITSIADGPLPMATIDMAGQARQCCLAYVPEAQVGQFVLVQNGFAHSVMSDEDAALALETMDEFGLINKPPSTA